MNDAPDDLARIEAAIAALPELTYQVFCLRRFDHLDHPAIAARLGITERQVEKEMARAIYLIDRKLSRGGLWRLVPLCWR